MLKYEAALAESKVRLSDAQWNSIVAALSGNVASRAKHDGHHYRNFVEAVLWVAINRAFWSELPAEYGSCRSVYIRYVRWCEADTWSKVEGALGPGDLGALLGLLLVKHRDEQRKRKRRRGRRSSMVADGQAAN
ncbi:transposase [Lysobacter antibioticus]|uniref:transposase n=1 Tax=Lysobacter antibioticus TaxID=84531 RepID=UPI0009DF20D1|nr:transposase [Lysobacter antibioticus]